MSDIVATAKALLKKGIALGDEELINMANSILHSEEKTEELHNVVDTITDEYNCTSCSHLWKTKTKPKSCPNCKKRKFVVKTEKKKTVVQDKPKPQIAFSPSAGKEVSYGYRQSISVGQNQFIDDGKLCTEDKKFDKKYGKKFSIQERTREEAKMVDVKCESCDKPFKMVHSLYELTGSYPVCTRCATRGR